MNAVLVFFGEMNYSADVLVSLLGQDGEPRKVPRLSLTFTFEQRVLLLVQGEV